MDLKNFKDDLREVLKKHDVTLGVDIQGGDTHGMNWDFIVTDNKTKQDHTLNWYSAYLDAHDLETE